jgi:predicted dithiol-disulfide oxidoreductase (DUF899 family)
VPKEQDADSDAKIFHTYSTFSAGLGSLSIVHALLDICPSGRDETGPGKRNMWWVKHKEEYPAVVGAVATEAAATAKPME